MELYTCIDGFDLYEENKAFGAWGKEERKKFEEHEDVVYSFDVDPKYLEDTCEEYSYCVKKGSKLSNLEIIDLN